MTEPLTLPAQPKVDPEERVRRQPPYHVILLDDDHHTFEYVITMLQQLFGYPREKGFQMALEVHTAGRCIVLTTSKEHAELKVEQIHAFGPDPLSSQDCAGSMSAILEPAY
ncbi:MAG: ATP-dependent Clp protease adaptor ClpS [Gemmataceae bacterium]